MVAYLNTLGHLSIVAERSLDKRLIGVFFVTSLSCCRLSLFFFLLCYILLSGISFRAQQFIAKNMNNVLSHIPLYLLICP